MNATVNEAPMNTLAINPVTTSRTYLWLIKRELWEHRAIVITPLVFALLIIFGMAIAAFQLLHQLHLDPNAGFDALAQNKIPFDKIRVISFVAMAALFNFVMLFVVGYYSLDALYAERRDRSVLFWKSLPLSDTETVIAKLMVIVVIAPLIGLAFALATQLIIAIIFTLALLTTGSSFVLQLWDVSAIGEIVILLVYGVMVQALWFLPVWAWCLLASAWARRSPFIVSIVPPLALIVLEGIVFRTRHIAQIFGERLNGVFPLKNSLAGVEGKNGHFVMPEHVTNLIDPSRFLASPDLWVGLVIAGGFIAAAVWMRRYREAN